MGDELLPVGQACNLGCTYCYENPMREAGNTGGTYDVNLILKALEKRNTPFSVFGGEPLLMKFDDLTKVLEYGYNRYGHTGVQSNGSLIEARHIDLFKRCKTHVGISIDGPGALNSPRKSNTPGIDTTERTLINLEWLLREGISIGLIITLHRANCGAASFPTFIEWLKKLDTLGIQNARLHLLEGHHDRSINLTEDEQVDVLIKLHKLESEELKVLKFDKFREMLKLLENPDAEATCTWKECDSYNTAAVQGISGQGTMHNCGRTNKDGVDWAKSDSMFGVRQIILFNTPQEFGGCKDCRFFLACRGYCPGTAIDTDWRNRTELCGVIKRLYTYFEGILRAGFRTPFTDRTDRFKREAEYIQARAMGQTSGWTHRPHEDWSVVDGKLVMKLEVV